jgi:hypothetical protein
MIVERKLPARQLTDDGTGLSVRLAGWPSASNCIEIEMTHLMSLGQKWVEAALLSM